MSGALILAVPSKGRLQENAEAFFARSGLELVKPRGARDYRGAIAGLDGVEIAYLSAAEITAQLGQGAVHLGITGEDLVREMIPDADREVVFIDQLGFGFANVVVAVPQAWIDVRSMADLDDVATAFRLKHERKMRLATKYLNLTRGFFADHGVIDYRIVESSGATEGAPAAGTAETDRRHHHHRHDARRQRAQGDRRRHHPALASKPRGRARRRWDGARATARLVLDRIVAHNRAHAYREVRTSFAGLNDALLTTASEIRRGRAVRWAHLVRHDDAALPARTCTRSRPSCANTAPRPWWWRTRLRVRARQSAVRPADAELDRNGAAR